MDEPARDSALLDLLRVRLVRPDLEYSEPPTPLGGGFSNEILRFGLADPPAGFEHSLVLRRSQDDEESEREATIQDRVTRSGFDAPPVLLHGSAAAGLGRPFILTPLVSGRTFDSLVRPTTAVGAFRRIGRQLAGVMGALHAVPTAPIVDALEQVGWPASRLDSLGVLTEVDALAHELDAPDLVHARTWLRDHQPIFDRSVVCHGDLHPFNLLFEHGQVVAVLDWELARVADPAFDVARTVMLLRMAPYPMPRAARRVIRRLAARLAVSFVAGYRKIRPLDDGSLRWHEALHCLRTLTIVRVGVAQAAPPRLRRTADVWLPVASELAARFTAITAVPISEVPT